MKIGKKIPIGRKIPIHITFSYSTTCCTCYIFKDSPREKSTHEITKWELGKKHLQLNRISPFFFQTSPTCNERVSYASSGVFTAAAMCHQLVGESAFARIGVDARQVWVWVHGPGQKLLFWGQESHVAEVPVIICKRHTDF